jgi:hypothetical protein
MQPKLKTASLCLSLLLAFTTKAQVNLVPNGSFETLSACPGEHSQVHLAAPWFQPGEGTSDLYAVCASWPKVGVPNNNFGYQFPRTGNNYAGLFTLAGDYREYIEVPLSHSLTADTKYFVSFYVSLADTFIYTSSTIGAFFSSSRLAVNHSSPIPVVPQVQNQTNNYFNKTTWIKVSGSFLATGDESFLTIGNFNTTASSNSMAISTKTATQNQCCVYVYVDDVCVSTDSTLNEEVVGLRAITEGRNINIFPNPASGIFFIERSSYPIKMNIRVYNSFLDIVKELPDYGGDYIDLTNQEDGVYTINFWNKDINSIKKIVKLKNQ